MTTPIIEAADPIVEHIIAALAALDPEARERVLLAAGIDPGPRSWTRTGRDLGIAQEVDADGYIRATYPREVWRTHRVYFIQAGEPDDKGLALVKIGFSTDVERRLRELQTASAQPLKLLNCTIGTQAIERFIHGVLKDRHVRGEWFRIYDDDISLALACMVEEGISWW